ncbi:hypothetical protein [Pantoea sp. C2G6]|uniref:hypothetical protein n=1 Tax=Pantoea sp. C2G6 TaxID=3243084 RepID=UPI003ED9ABA3
MMTDEKNPDMDNVNIGLPAEALNQFASTNLSEREVDFRWKMSKITTSVVSDFMHSKNFDLCCRGCGARSIIIPQVQIYLKHEGTPVLSQHAYYSSFMEGDDCKTTPNCYEYSIICKNCGLTSKINAAVILEWFNDKEGHCGRSD